MKIDLVRETEKCGSLQSRRTIKLNIKTLRMAKLFQAMINTRLKGLTLKKRAKEKVYSKKKRVT